MAFHWVWVVKWILLTTGDERMHGRLLKNGGVGGPRALRAFGKACKVNEGLGCKALVVYSSGNWTRERENLSRGTEFVRALCLVVFV
jgi:hypothetical protein